MPRALAEAHKTSWQEYWPFLDAFADLRSVEGLAKMETFLLKQRVLLLVQTMASWKGGGRGGVLRRVVEQSAGRHSKVNVSIAVESGQWNEKVQDVGSKDQRFNRQKVQGSAVPEAVNEMSCFSPSIPYTVGQQYVINPDQCEDSKDLSNSFKSPQAVSDDDDSYFSAESSSDSEEDNNGDKVRDRQGRARNSTSAVSTDTPGSHGLIGAFWSTIGRLKEYISPRKASPSAPVSGKSDCSVSEHETIGAESSSVSAKILGSTESLESTEKSVQIPRSEAQSVQIPRSEAQSVQIPRSEAQSVQIPRNDSQDDHNYQDCVSSSIATDSKAVTQSTVSYEIDKNKNISVSCMSAQNSSCNSDTRNLSVQNSRLGHCDSYISNTDSERTSGEKSKTNKSDKSALSQWQYRDSQAQSSSPETSPHKLSNPLLGPSEIGLNADNRHAHPKISVSAVKPCQASMAISEPGDEKKPGCTTESASLAIALDDSFNTKLDSLCHSLSEFSLKSPPTRSSESVVPLTTSTGSCDDVASLTSTSEMAVSEPSVLLFVGKRYSKFISDLSPQSRQRFGHRRDDGSYTGDHQIPTVILRQDLDGETVLADVFLPTFPDVAGGSVLDAAPVMLEEAHRDALRSVWVNFMVAFPKSSDAKHVCSLDQPMVVKTAVTGVVTDPDKCWTFRFVLFCILGRCSIEKQFHVESVLYPQHVVNSIISC